MLRKSDELTMDRKEIEKKIRHRIKERLRGVDLWKFRLKKGKVYIAGGFFDKSPPRDIDVFPVEEGQFDKVIAVPPYELEDRTKNATTFSDGKGLILQFCNYYHASLVALVESFDFSHIQIGCEVDCLVGVDQVGDVYFSDDYVLANVLNTSVFKGSEYPFCSLVRMFKYHHRGVFGDFEFKYNLVKVLEAIIERGFEDFEDFEDQLAGFSPSPTGDGALPNSDGEQERVPVLSKLYNVLKNPDRKG
jgi:hypothetical protein